MKTFLLTAAVVTALSATAVAQTQPAPTLPPPPIATGATQSPWAMPPPPSDVQLRAPELLRAASDDDARAARLGRIMEHHIEIGVARRRHATYTALIVAGVGVVAGVALLATSGSDDRDETERSVAGGVFLGVGLGAGLGAGIAQLVTTPMEQVTESYRAARSQGVGSGILVDQVESAWRVRAERMRSQRQLAAGVLIVGGAILGATGALVSFVGDRSDRGEAAILGATSFLFGSLLTLAGSAVLYAFDEVESGWEIWQRAR